MFTEAALRAQRRDMANQVRAMTLAIAGAFGEDIKPTLQELDG
jgi:hypothetical protein